MKPIWDGNFQIRYIAFLDVLGFKNKIENSGQYSDVLSFVISLPTHLADLAKPGILFDADVECTAFSDSIVISALAKPNSPIGIVPIANIVRTLFWEFI